MYFLNVILTLFTLLAAVQAHLKNSSQEFRLKTCIKPNQLGKEAFNDLWVGSYHTGAGLSDAVLTHDESGGAKAFLNGTNGKVKNVTYQNVVFDLGNPFPWSMVMSINTEFYAAWEPVEINAGGGASAPKGQSGFWINDKGLQWTDYPTKPPDFKFNQFLGWLVCDWWHGAPQLFFRISYGNFSTPCSCAEVYLIPEYV